MKARHLFRYCSLLSLVVCVVSLLMWLTFRTKGPPGEVLKLSADKSFFFRADYAAVVRKSPWVMVPGVNGRSRTADPIVSVPFIASQAAADRHVRRARDGASAGGR
jgi:hypothetical protein